MKFQSIWRTPEISEKINMLKIKNVAKLGTIVILVTIIVQVITEALDIAYVS